MTRHQSDHPTGKQYLRNVFEENGLKKQYNNDFGFRGLQYRFEALADQQDQYDVDMDDGGDGSGDDVNKNFRVAADQL